MSLVTKKLSFVLLVLLFLAPSVMMAQGVTTAAMSGTVTDDQGQVLPGATVIATHLPTGTNYGTTTRENGQYNLNNLRVGGPYSVKVSFIGYNSQSKEDVTLKLGQNLKIDFQLVSSTISTNTVNVVAEKSAIISLNRTGAATNVGLETIQAFPTISRNFQDFAKLTPQFDGRSSSAAGRSARYNNIQIDGTQYNDLFGLGSSGTPGGTAGTTPISLDAIQEFQVVVAPYDVRMGGFTGGGINAITKSGTNTFSGSAYYLGRNQNFIGYKPAASRDKYGKFTDYTTGFRLGGPVLKDQLFFFVSGELGKRTDPINNTVLTTSSTIGANADRARTQTLKWGYDPGTYGDVDALRPSNKLFLRFDYNLSDQHRLVARLNYVDAAQDNWGRYGNQLGFSDRNYQMNSKTFAPVVQLTSTFGNTMTNELTLGYTTIRDHRVPNSSAFPSIEIYDGSNNIRMGGEEYSQANELDQDIFEFTDNFSFYMGSHVFTVGTHNEFFKFRNLYIANQDGFYLFNNIGDYEAGKIYQYQISYANNGDRGLAAKFNAIQFGGYVQDEWTVNSDLKATIGLRIDIPTFPTAPAYNPTFDQSFGYLGLGTDKVPSGKLLFSPRLGINWDASGDRTLQVRGGVGLFTGRIAYVWLSNQYGNTGIEFTRINVTNPGFKFGDKGTGYNTLDPLNQPVAGTAGLAAIKTSEVDVTDKDFKMPQILRINGAVDKTLPFGLTGTVEAIYSKTINDLLYQDLNLKADPTLVGPAYTGARVMYSATKVNSNFTNIVLMKNTNEGYAYSLTAQVQGTLPWGIYTNLFYTYNRSLDLNSVGSSQAYSQYRYNPVTVDPNAPTLSTSNYEVRHRISAAVSYGFEYFGNYKTTVSLFYNGQSGRPFSYTYTGNINGDGATTNDMIYIPTADEISSKMNIGSTTTTNSKTYFKDDPAMRANLEQFIQNDSYLNSHRGQIMERNSITEPWINMVDMKFAQEVPLFQNHRVEVSLDILNVLNLLNRDWGWVQSISNQNQSIITYTKTSGDSKDVYTFKLNNDVITGQPKYDYFVPDDLSSRFQFQLGVRYSF